MDTEDILADPTAVDEQMSYKPQEAQPLVESRQTSKREHPLNEDLPEPEEEHQELHAKEGDEVQEALPAGRDKEQTAEGTGAFEAPEKESEASFEFGPLPTKSQGQSAIDSTEEAQEQVSTGAGPAAAAEETVHQVDDNKREEAQPASAQQHGDQKNATAETQGIMQTEEGERQPLVEQSEKIVTLAPLAPGSTDDGQKQDFGIADSTVERESEDQVAPAVLVEGAKPNVEQEASKVENAEPEPHVKERSKSPNGGEEGQRRAGRGKKPDSVSVTSSGIDSQTSIELASSPGPLGRRSSTRVRNEIPRFDPSSPPSQRRKSLVSTPTIESRGAGVPLGEIEPVNDMLSKIPANHDLLQALHRFLFNKPGKVHTRKKEIRQFSGFVWTESFPREKAVEKLTERKWKIPILKDLCQLLDLEKTGDKATLVERVISFLEHPRPRPQRASAKKSAAKTPGSGKRGKRAKGDTESEEETGVPASGLDEDDEPVQSVLKRKGGVAGLQEEETLEDNRGEGKRKGKYAKTIAELEPGEEEGREPEAVTPKKRKASEVTKLPRGSAKKKTKMSKDKAPDKLATTSVEEDDPASAEMDLPKPAPELASAE